MASRIGPRSVKDATRFTSTIPHATSKAASPSSTASSLKPTSRIPGETPEQRVRRLRAAHLAAQHAQVSRADRIIDGSRRFLDVAHKWTIGGVILFTAVAGVVSVYSVWDMLQYNRARRAEWVEAQKKLEADELATARLAYLKGLATEEQILLVEEANQEAAAQGVKLPPLLAPPEHRTHFEERVKPAFQSETIKEERTGKGIFGFFSGKTADSGKAGESTVDSGAPLSSPSDVVQTIEDKARLAWDAEKVNQRNGGSLDQLGLKEGEVTTKKGWWPW